jgi:hypothetical protein
MILILGAVSYSVIVAPTALAEAHVQRYLDALARDDLTSATRLAGLEPSATIPLGDDAPPGIRRIISTSVEGDGTITVLAEYGDETDAERVPFNLEPAPSLLGLIPAWQFTQPPVTTLEVGADHHDRVTVGAFALTAAAAGETVEVAVFIPARVTVRLDEPLLSAEPASVRVTARPLAAVMLAVESTPRFERAVQQQVDRVLDECATQQVLLPSGCPFGIEIGDRVLDLPTWRIVTSPVVTLSLGEQAGVWRITGEGEAQVVVTTQRLFDGGIDVRDEVIVFTVNGDVVLDADERVLTFYSPEG